MENWTDFEKIIWGEIKELRKDVNTLKIRVYTIIGVSGVAVTLINLIGRI